MRLFIAIELPQHIRLYLIRMQEALRPVFGGKWTRPAQLHITLKFLGETPDAQLPDLIGVLSEVELDTEILLQSKGVLYLPPHGPVRIVAAGFEDVAVPRRSWRSGLILRVMKSGIGWRVASGRRTLRWRG